MLKTDASIFRNKIVAAAAASSFSGNDEIKTARYAACAQVDCCTTWPTKVAATASNRARGTSLLIAHLKAKDRMASVMP